MTVLSAKLGHLLWISKQSHLDIAFDVTDLPGRINTSTVEDLKRLNKIIKRVNSDHVSLKFQSLGKNLEIGLMNRVFANGPGDRGSILGRVITKTQKMVLDAILVNTQYYKVRIKVKIEQSR